MTYQMKSKKQKPAVQVFSESGLSPPARQFARAKARHPWETRRTAGSNWGKRIAELPHSPAGARS
jgi:hypothetical protein